MKNPVRPVLSILALSLLIAPQALAQGGPPMGMPPDAQAQKGFKEHAERLRKDCPEQHALDEQLSGIRKQLAVIQKEAFEGTADDSAVIERMRPLIKREIALTEGIEYKTARKLCQMSMNLSMTREMRKRMKGLPKRPGPPGKAPPRAP